LRNGYDIIMSLYPKQDFREYSNNDLIKLLEHRMKLYNFYKVESFESGKNLRIRINKDIKEIRKELGLRCQK